MVFLIFSLVMLSLALIAKLRSPSLHTLPVLWFFISWLPSELPWVFGLFQLIVSIIYFTVVYFTHPETSAETCLALLISLVALRFWYTLHKKTFLAKTILENALQRGLGVHYGKEFDKPLSITANSISLYRDWLKPFSFDRDNIERIRDIAYGTHPRQQLDILRRNDISSNDKQLRPVLLHIHGGAWMTGKKDQQAKPLLHYLAQQGWICVDTNYRLAPTHRYPDAIIDVKMAIAWIKTNIKNFGGDADFIAVTGESAGGHLCALAALTANHPEFQPGFENIDTHIQAALPLYGIYDFTNTSQTSSGNGLHKLLTRYVMPARYADNPTLWKNASPLLQIHDNLPPLFIIHGSNDCLAPVEAARIFANAVKEKSKSAVVYAEIEGAQHAFEMFHAVRTEFTIEIIGKFLLHCYTMSQRSDD